MLQPHYDNGESAAPVVARIVHDAKKLIEQEFHLVKVELLDQVEELQRSTAKFAFGFLSLTLGVVFLAITMEQLLEMAGLTSWISFAATGALFVIVGTVVLKTRLSKPKEVGGHS